MLTLSKNKFVRRYRDSRTIKLTLKLNPWKPTLLKLEKNIREFKLKFRKFILWITKSMRFFVKKHHFYPFTNAISKLAGVIRINWEVCVKAGITGWLTFETALALRRHRNGARTVDIWWLIHEGEGRCSREPLGILSRSFPCFFAPFETSVLEPRLRKKFRKIRMTKDDICRDNQNSADVT